MATVVVTCFLLGVAMMSSPLTVAEGGDLDPNFAPLVDLLAPGGEDDEEDFLEVVARRFTEQRPPAAFFPGRVLNSSSSPSSSILFVPS